MCSHVKILPRVLYWKLLHVILTDVCVLMKIYIVFVWSAGGTGVLLNVDRVAEMLEGLGHTGIQVRGLSDSGWFLDNKQYHCTDCVDTASCAPTETIKRGIKYGISLSLVLFISYQYLSQDTDSYEIIDRSPNNKTIIASTARCGWLLWLAGGNKQNMRQSTISWKEMMTSISHI